MINLKTAVSFHLQRVTEFTVTNMGFVVALVVTCQSVPGKDRLKVVTVDIGDDTILTIATNAPNIREGTRTCVALIGSTIEIGGQTEMVKKTNVGGIISEGMICDSVMLGWTGGAAGLAVQIPSSYDLGTSAPTSKPRMDGQLIINFAGWIYKNLLITDCLHYGTPITLC